MHFREKYRSCKQKLKETIKIIISYSGNLKEIKSMPGNSLVLWGIPEHGNLGDQAITYAEIKFLEDVFPGRNIFLIPERKCLEYALPFRRIEKDNDFVFISHGGGNMGTLYQYQENCRQLLIKNIRCSKIVVFPQSTDYVVGTNEHKKAERLYSQNKGLYLFARDKVSYDKMRKLFPQCKVGLVPDIVTSVKIKDAKNMDRDSVLCLLRSDKEANKESKNRIENLLDYIGRDKCRFSDTYKQEFKSLFEGQDKQIENFWLDVRSSKLVVTDRLHGMIFSMINHTPCIAFDNTTGKVTAFYKTWIKGCQYIKICDAVDDDIKSFIDRCLFDDVDNDYKIEMDREFALLKDVLLA